MQLEELHFGKQERLSDANAGPGIEIDWSKGSPLISATGGGGGSWYEYAEGVPTLYIGPGYGDTPSDVNTLSLGLKKQDSSSAGIDIGSNVDINTYKPDSRVWISADGPGSNVHLVANDTVFIDAVQKITLVVDGLSLELDKAKLQKLIDSLNE